MGYMCTERSSSFARFRVALRVALELFALSVLNVSQRLLALFGISVLLASVVAPEVSHEVLVEWGCLASPLL